MVSANAASKAGFRGGEGKSGIDSTWKVSRGGGYMGNTSLT